MTLATRYASATLALVGLAATAPGVLAQAIHIDIANPTLMPGETTAITLLASFPAGDYAMGGVAVDVVANVLQGDLSNPTLVRPRDGPGTRPGTAGPDGISDILAGQIHFPIAGIIADPENPIAFHTFEFTWDGTLSGRVLLDIETRTRRFDVYLDRDTPRSESRLDDLIEAHAVIVVPAPSGAIVLGIGALALGRRRR
ncbi:MAG: hypothetical protein RIE77_04430 [Phycisphaerales bacterium]|jgi:hypothetical protein